MIKIFDENDRDFSTNGNIAIEPIKCKEYKKKSLNGWYIEVEVSVKYKKYIEQDKLCVVKTKSKLRPQAFRIHNPQVENKIISFTADHVMFDAEGYFLVDVRPTNQNGQNALSYINERTDKKSPFKIYSNVSTEDTAYFIRKNLLEAWAVIEERWNGVFDADNWDISFLERVGNDNGETISYGKNMQGIRIFEDWSEVCTRIYPVGSDELMLDEKYIDSDIQYNIPYTRTITFNSELEFEEETSEDDKKQMLFEELRHNAEVYLEENKYPRVSYEINSNVNQNMEIGDTIHVKHPLVTLITEVLEYEHNIISNKIETLVFGNYTRDVKSKFDSIKDNIQKVQDNLMEGITKQDIVIKQQTELINSMNKNGIVYIDENEILILDKVPKETAKNVWRFGLGGIGFSSNGYEGPFETAITMDGQINAKFITTGTMSVERIEGLQNTLNDYLVSINLNSTNIQQLVGTQNSIIKNFDNYTTTESMQTLINQSAEGVLETASKTYTTQTDFTTGLETTKKESIEEAVKNANSDTDIKLKNYSTTQEMNAAIDLKFNEINIEVGEKYTTKTEFTAGLETTKNEAILDAVNSANSSTDKKLKLYPTTSEMNAAIKIKVDAITLDVSKKLDKDEFSTRLQVDSKSVQIAWNNISKCIQFIDGELQIKNEMEELLMSLGEYGLYFYYNGKVIGHLGQTFWDSDEKTRGITMDIEKNGNFLSWGSKDTDLGAFITQFGLFKGNVGEIDAGLNMFDTLQTNGYDINLGSDKQITIGNNGIASNYGTEYIFTFHSNRVVNCYNNIEMNNYALRGASNVVTTTEGNETVDRLDVAYGNDTTYLQLTSKGSGVFGITMWQSDGRLKENIKPSDINAINTIMQINHRQFDWKKDNKHEEIGYIAQEIQKINKDFVIEVEQTNGEKVLQINETKIIPYISKAIQEQQNYIKRLEEKIKQIIEINKIQLNEDIHKIENTSIKEKIIDYGNIEMSIKAELKRKTLKVPQNMRKKFIIKN